MQRLIKLLVLSFLIQMVFTPNELWAQIKDIDKGEAYAAPGMMVKLRRTVITDTAAKPKPASVLSSIILKRFWITADTTKTEAYNAFIRELYSHIKYPPSSLKNQVEGAVFLRFVVGADELVKNVVLENKSLVWVGDATTEAKDALAEEAMRAAKTLRFEPTDKPTDEVAVPVQFTIQ